MQKSKQHAFDSFCKKILKHEARDYYDEMKRQRDIILLSYFLELSDREIGDKLNMLSATVQYERTSTLR